MTVMLHHGVSAQAEASPDATAIVFKGERMSYRELEESSNQIAHALHECNCGDNDRVAILMPKMPATVVAILGALKAGCIYVPLDPLEAPERLARILQSIDARCVLAAGNVGPLLRNVLAIAGLTSPPRIGWLDEELTADVDPHTQFTLSDLAAVPTAPPPRTRDEDRVAHLLFTSGSTGEPKGVMVRHRNVLHFIRWASAYFGISRNDRISQHPPLRFDVSTFDIFGALWAGAQLHMVPRELSLLPHRLAQFIREENLTQWFSVPSVMNLMARFDVIQTNDFPSLQRVIFAGEVLPTPTLRYWMKRVTQASFTNLYGPTETTIASSYHTVRSCPENDDAPIPIGRPCRGEELLLLDEELRPVTETDTVADLYIRGQGVTAGYWRDRDKTADAFVEKDGHRLYRTGDRAWRDADGLFYYVGRADAQVKMRGYRIELGEIEAAFNALPEIRESIVVAIDSDGFESITICCAYSTAPGASVTGTELRSRLAEKLPSYMIPARMAAYGKLPRNTSGKYDRAAITADFKEQREPTAPADEPRVARFG